MQREGNMALTHTFRSTKALNRSFLVLGSRPVQEEIRCLSSPQMYACLTNCLTETSMVGSMTVLVFFYLLHSVWKHSLTLEGLVFLFDEPVVFDTTSIHFEELILIVGV